MADNTSYAVLQLASTGSSNWFACNDSETAGMDVVWGTGVGAGAVDLEFTNDPSNTNATYTSTSNRVTYPARQVGGPNIYKFFRAKVSTNVTGGTLDAVYLSKGITTHR